MLLKGNFERASACCVPKHFYEYIEEPIDFLFNSHNITIATNMIILTILLAALHYVDIHMLMCFLRKCNWGFC